MSDNFEYYYLKLKQEYDKIYSENKELFFTLNELYKECERAKSLIDENESLKNKVKVLKKNFIQMKDKKIFYEINYAQVQTEKNAIKYELDAKIEEIDRKEKYIKALENNIEPFMKEVKDFLKERDDLYYQMEMLEEEYYEMKDLVEQYENINVQKDRATYPRK